MPAIAGWLAACKWNPAGSRIASTTEFGGTSQRQEWFDGGRRVKKGGEAAFSRNELVQEKH